MHGWSHAVEFMGFIRRDYLSFSELLALDPDLDCFSKLSSCCQSDLSTSKSAPNDCGITVRTILSKKPWGGGPPQVHRVTLAGEFLLLLLTVTTWRFIFCNCCFIIQLTFTCREQYAIYCSLHDNVDNKEVDHNQEHMSSFVFNLQTSFWFRSHSLQRNSA